MYKATPRELELFDEIHRLHSSMKPHDIEAVDERARQQFFQSHDHLLSIEEIDEVIDEVRKNVK